MTIYTISLYLLVAVASTFGEPLEERVITDINDVYTGVTIDYKYNETGTPPEGGALSSPGCPKSDEGTPWVYYGNSSVSKCYLVGQQGPCKDGQKLFVDKGDLTGYCNCECFEDTGTGNFNSTDIRFCHNWRRDAAYFPDLKKCFVMYEQGPCKENEWLVIKSNVTEKGRLLAAHTTCEERKCPEEQIPYVEGEEMICVMEANTQSQASFLPNQCPEQNMRYSTLLQTCVKKADSFSVG